jgi:TPP-dependent pyruvate/acetoin dehydrogenase alpha subunit
MISNVIEREQHAAGVAPAYLTDVFRGALAAYYVEERMKTFAKQGKCAFVASCRGHEVAQAGITKLLEPVSYVEYGIPGGSRGSRPRLSSRR